MGGMGGGEGVGSFFKILFQLGSEVSRISNSPGEGRTELLRQSIPV